MPHSHLDFPLPGPPIEWNHPAISRLQATITTRRAYRDDQLRVSHEPNDFFIRTAARRVVQALERQLWDDEERLEQLRTAARENQRVVRQSQMRGQVREQMQERRQPRHAAAAGYQGNAGAAFRWGGYGTYGAYGGVSRAVRVEFVPARRRREREAGRQEEEREGGGQEDAPVELGGRDIKGEPRDDLEGDAAPAELPA